MYVLSLAGIFLVTASWSFVPLLIPLKIDTWSSPPNWAAAAGVYLSPFFYCLLINVHCVNNWNIGTSQDRQNLCSLPLQGSQLRVSEVRSGYNYTLGVRNVILNRCMQLQQYVYKSLLLPRRPDLVWLNRMHAAATSLANLIYSVALYKIYTVHIVSCQISVSHSAS